MKTLLAAIALAGILAIADTPVQQWAGSNQAAAQDSGACFENCTNVRRWPADQCRKLCRGRSSR